MASPRSKTTKGATKKPAAPKPPEPKPARGPSEFIDAALMERALKLRQEGKTMKAIGEELGVKATGYLAKKIKQHHGPNALDVPRSAAEAK